MIPQKFLLFVALGIPAIGVHARAQESSISPISTERPSAGPSADAIPAGSLQSESGTNFSLQRHSYTVDMPENLVRFGVSEHLELRFQSNNAITEHTSREGYSSFSSQDAAASAKVIFGAPNRLMPRSAIVSLTFPTGGDDQSSGSYDPGVNLIWTQNLPKNYSLVEVAAGTLTTVDGARRGFWYPSLGLNRNVTPAFGTFAEFAPSVTPDRTFAYIVDGGLTLASTPTRQVDVRVGYQHDSAGYHTLISFGYSFRLDHFLSRPSLLSPR